MRRLEFSVASVSWLALGLASCGEPASDASTQTTTQAVTASVTTGAGATGAAATTTAASSSVTSAAATSNGSTAATSTGTGGAATSSGTDSVTTTGQASVTGTEGTTTTGGGGATGSGAFPFPQNVEGEFCNYPNYDNAAVRAAYESWKEKVVSSEGAGEYLRVRKPDSGSVIGSTVSEGQGYGMLLAVYFGDQELFDNLWLYTKQYLNENGLMHWEIDPNGGVIGTGAALDGDEDMAWALVMASRQWSESPRIASYHDDAVALIEAMWDHEIDHTRNGMPLPGDTWGGADITNISYYAPAYYRVFGEVTGNVEGWNQVIETSYAIIERSLNEANGNADNGLVPAWCDSQGVPVVAFEGAPTHFQNDSTRTPFRVGQDYCYYGEPRALSYMQKIASFYAGVGVANIIDGYDLDGTPHPEHSVNGSQAASFVGPAAVAAMGSDEFQSFLDEAYLAVAGGGLDAGTIYYQASWEALSLLMLSGNFIEFPAP
ncbi:MAG TPA: glycosyl hydrolase family 8 [Polyangiaceae bacterium]